MKMDIHGVIAPHAGYAYSGATAAHAYAQLEGASYDVAVILAPSHREYFDGVSVYPGSAYATPLGEMQVSTSLRADLTRATSLVRTVQAGHGEEHAVEVQLPFLRRTIGAVEILPIVMGDQRRDYCVELANALAEVLRPVRALVVASTDLSHFHSSGIAQRLDALVIDDIRRGDPESLLGHLERGEAEACGGGPTAASLLALRSLGASHVSILHHCTSGDITGDHSSVVGYLSAAVFH
jgi:AmmeMemoRadiSam system protein B